MWICQTNRSTYNQANIQKQSKQRMQMGQAHGVQKQTTQLLYHVRAFNPKT
jgi:hypothetical protein